MEKLHIHNITKSHKGHPLSIEIRNDSNNLRIHAKWDGCCDINIYSNGTTPDDKITAENIDDVDYIHICEMQEFIDELQQLIDLAKENFDEKDFENYWC